MEISTLLPVFLFYDEVLADMGDDGKHFNILILTVLLQNLHLFVASSPTQRICRFHDRVMELHEGKVEEVTTSK